MQASFKIAIQFQDTFGNTALHLAMCQANIPWECVLDLLENGARICLANHRGIRPVDLTSKPILQRLQSHIVDSCWLSITEPSNQHQGNKRVLLVTVLGYFFICSGVLTLYIYSAIVTSSNVKSSVTPGCILRKLRSNPGESVDDTSCASGGLSSTGSIRSKSSNRSLEFSRKVSTLCSVLPGVKTMIDIALSIRATNMTLISILTSSQSRKFANLRHHRDATRKLNFLERFLLMTCDEIFPSMSTTHVEAFFFYPLTGISIFVRPKHLQLGNGKQTEGIVRKLCKDKKRNFLSVRRGLALLTLLFGRTIVMN